MKRLLLAIALILTGCKEHIMTAGYEDSVEFVYSGEVDPTPAFDHSVRMIYKKGMVLKSNPSYINAPMPHTLFRNNGDDIVPIKYVPADAPTYKKGDIIWNDTAYNPGKIGVWDIRSDYSLGFIEAKTPKDIGFTPVMTTTEMAPVDDESQTYLEASSPLFYKVKAKKKFNAINIVATGEYVEVTVKKGDTTIMDAQRHDISSNVGDDVYPIYTPATIIIRIPSTVGEDAEITLRVYNTKGKVRLHTLSTSYVFDYGLVMIKDFNTKDKNINVTNVDKFGRIDKGSKPILWSYSFKMVGNYTEMFKLKNRLREMVQQYGVFDLTNHMESPNKYSLSTAVIRGMVMDSSFTIATNESGEPLDIQTVSVTIQELI